MVVAPPRAHESSIQTVVFGKLPNRSDFVRINATHPVALEFDELIQSALEQFRKQEGWEKAYDTSPMVDICYTSRDKKWIFLGAMRTSRDQSGRRYPLVAGVAFPSQAISGERRLIPIACEVFYEGLRTQLSNAVAHSLEGVDCRQFLDFQTRLWHTSSSEDMPLAAEIIGHFLDNQHPSVLESPLLESEPSGTLAQALLNISYFRDFLRRFGNLGGVQAIELPLCGDRGVTVLHASGWLSLLSSIYGQDWTGSFLLTQSRESVTASLHVSFGEMPDHAIVAALGGGNPEDGRLNLWAEQKTWQAQRLYPESAYALDRLIANPNLVLSGLSAFLRETSKKIAVTNS